MGGLAFATYCFYLAATGGHTGKSQERVVSAMVGALLQLDNLELCLGLIFSAEARAHYASNDSLGLVNDYLRLADEVLAQLEQLPESERDFRGRAPHERRPFGD